MLIVLASIPGITLLVLEVAAIHWLTFGTMAVTSDSIQLMGLSFAAAAMLLIGLIKNYVTPILIGIVVGVASAIFIPEYVSLRLIAILNICLFVDLFVIAMTERAISSRPFSDLPTTRH